MLQINNITLRRGTKLLFEEASLRLDVGYKAGLIGRNGTGKTSLLKLIMREIHEDQGDFSIPSTWRISHLAQELPDTNELAFAYARAGDTEWIALQEKIAVAEKENMVLRSVITMPNSMPSMVIALMHVLPLF